MPDTFLSVSIIPCIYSADIGILYALCAVSY